MADSASRKFDRASSLISTSSSWRRSSKSILLKAGRRLGRARVCLLGSSFTVGGVGVVVPDERVEGALQLALDRLGD